MEDMSWKVAYELQSCFREIVRLMTDWTVSDRDVLVHELSRCLQYIAPHTLRRFGLRPRGPYPIVAKHLTFLGGPRMYDVIDFEVGGGEEEVSLHVPLHRFLVGVVVEGVARHASLAESLPRRIANEVGSVMLLAEPVLHAVVAVAQINIGMWRRNGTMAESQVKKSGDIPFSESEKRVKETDLNDCSVANTGSGYIKNA
jgi:hypothetical protein